MDPSESNTAVETQEAPAAPPVPPVPPAATSAAAPGPGGPRRRHGGGLTIGILLIVFGVLILVGRVVPNLSVWSLWPLIIIVLGVRQMVTGDGGRPWTVYRLFDGFSTVVVGVLFLGNTTGAIPWSVWWDLIALWPLLLVVIGLDMIGKALEQSWLRILGKVVSIGVLIYVGALAYGTGGGLHPWAFAWGESQPFAYEERVKGAESATLDLNAGSGELDITGGADGLVDASGETPYGEPTFDVERDGSKADVTLTLGQGSYVMVPGAMGAKADVLLSEDVLWDVRLETGAARVDADLADLSLSSLELRTGVTDAVVTLGEAPAGDTVPVDVRAGVSSVTIRVPEDVNARFRVESGLTSISYGSGIERVSGGEPFGGGEYLTEPESSADPEWDIRIASGVGSVRIETY